MLNLYGGQGRDRTADAGLFRAASLTGAARRTVAGRENHAQFVRWQGTGSNRRRGPFQGRGLTGAARRTVARRENHAQFVWWPGTGSNRRRRPFQGRALPLSYLALAVKQNASFGNRQERPGATSVASAFSGELRSQRVP